jgi:hypothetical protein
MCYHFNINPCRVKKDPAQGRGRYLSEKLKRSGFTGHLLSRATLDQSGHQPVYLAEALAGLLR